MRNKLLLGAALCAATLLAPRAFAGTATGGFLVNATVPTSCTIAAPDIQFGTYDAINGNTATTTVSITCFGIADGTEVDYTVGEGENYAQSGPYRSMFSAFGLLPYILSLSQGGPDIGNASPNGTTVLAGGVGTQTLYASIAPGINVPASNGYGDAVDLTANY